MQQSFYDWKLKKQEPLAYKLRKRKMAISYDNSMADFHNAVHLNIQFAGISTKKVGNSLIRIEGPGCMISAPWEPHKTAFSDSGSLLFMSVMDPGKLADALPGCEEKLHTFLLLPPEPRHALVRKYIPQNYFLSMMYGIYSKEFIDDIVERFRRNEIISNDFLHQKSESALAMVEIWHILTGFFARLLSRLTPEDLPAYPAESYLSLLPVFQLLSSAVDRRVAVEEAAEKCSMGVSSFRSLFRMVTGFPFAEYELNNRFCCAVAELNEKHLVIKEIAEKYGFYDASHFSRLFKEKMGMSPLKYVQEKRQDGSAQ
jgi:AraC-like DNA-binding protein